MDAKLPDTSPTWSDPDDAPELTDAFFEKAVWSIGERVVTREEGQREVARLRGRPAGSGTKISTTIRFDADLLAAFKAGGSGWQTRINDALREWLQSQQ